MRNEKVVKREDRLTSLPEVILQHILFFLPTKDAVGASILSTKWRYLWTSVPVLDFSDNLLYSTKSKREDQIIDNLLHSTKRKREDPIIKEKFTDFVYRVLLFHDSNIQKFFLKFTANYTASQVNAWISGVLWCPVRELVIKFSSKVSNRLPQCLYSCESITIKMRSRVSIRLPQCLFSCESLTTLKMKSLEHKLPALITFSSLTVLHLEYVEFTNTCDTPIQQVTFNLPVLEEFRLQECRWWNMNIIVFAPLLKSLYIEDVSCFNEDGDDYDNEMKIGAENLKSLTLDCNFVHVYSIHTLPSLLDESKTLVGTEFMGHSAVKVFREICNLKELVVSFETSFSSQYFQVTDGLFNQELSSIMPDLPKVIKLGVTDKEDCGNCSNLISLLFAMPNIEFLVFPDGLFRCDCLGEHFLTLATVPGHFLSHLRSIEFRCFCGYEHEICAVKFLLKNARVLKKMTIVYDDTLSADPRKQIEVYKKLLMLPRASDCSVIDIS